MTEKKLSSLYSVQAVLCTIPSHSLLSLFCTGCPLYHSISLSLVSILYRLSSVPFHLTLSCLYSVQAVLCTIPSHSLLSLFCTGCPLYHSISLSLLSILYMVSSVPFHLTLSCPYSGRREIQAVLCTIPSHSLLSLFCTGCPLYHSISLSLVSILYRLSSVPFHLTLSCLYSVQAVLCTIPSHSLFSLFCTWCPLYHSISLSLVSILYRLSSVPFHLTLSCLYSVQAVLCTIPSHSLLSLFCTWCPLYHSISLSLVSILYMVSSVPFHLTLSCLYSLQAVLCTIPSHSLLSLFCTGCPLYQSISLSLVSILYRLSSVPFHLTLSCLYSVQAVLCTIPSHSLLSLFCTGCPLYHSISLSLLSILYRLSSVPFHLTLSSLYSVQAVLCTIPSHSLLSLFCTGCPLYHSISLSLVSILYRLSSVPFHLTLSCLYSVHGVLCTIPSHSLFSLFCTGCPLYHCISLSLVSILYRLSSVPFHLTLSCLYSVQGVLCTIPSHSLLSLFCTGCPLYHSISLSLVSILYRLSSVPFHLSSMPSSNRAGEINYY